MAVGDASAQEASGKPNFLIIVTDDQGYADLRAYKHHAKDVKTPNMDRLASRGVLFTDAYASAPVCSPSRAGWVTGRHQVRWDPKSSFNCGLSKDDSHVAEIMKKNGYRTARFGKNDYGGSSLHRHNVREYPLNHGFDEFLGFKHGAMDNYSHFYYYGGPDRHILRRNRESHREDGVFFPDIVTREALRFIGDNRQPPFFLYLPLNQPHYPLQPEARYLERFQDIADGARRYPSARLSSMDHHTAPVLERPSPLRLRDPPPPPVPRPPPPPGSPDPPAHPGDRSPALPAALAPRAWVLSAR